MPSSPMLNQTSLIDLITKILHANIDKDPGIFSRYDRLWSTTDPSLGDRYMVSSGDVDALSCALDSIYEKHGLLIPSVECRDRGGRVWIGFRGDADPKSRRYATIWTSVYKVRYALAPVAAWEEGLKKLKEEMAAAIKEDSPSNNAASRGLRAPDSNVLGTRLAKATTLSSKQTLGTQGTTAPTAIAKRIRTHDIIGRSPTRPQETEEAVSAVDGGAQQQIIVVAEPCINMEQPSSAPLVEGEWIVIDVTVNEEDEWTEI